MPVKYTDELKARAVELVIHTQANPTTANGAITRVANERRLSKETLRVWVRKHKTPARPHRSNQSTLKLRTVGCDLSWPKHVGLTRS